ncbi:VOC family protein [Chryseolinea sp. H1M3-3]|uniref:VOC family protein n=1 Tax=Chryseolinea sp. H1M3-3 TaxID=3034144 RepID=UPI0023EA9526|nr:VOC family protein [Chryseolinea sp. H1M3-3]
MAQINPHINFNGNAEEALNFYKSVFGGEFSKIIRFKDIASEEFPIPDKEAHKIMHIALPIKQNFLFANDILEIMGRVNENENRSKIAITAESKEEAYKLFNGLSAGGQIEMPIDENPDGTYFAMFRDKYGIEWMVKFDPKHKGE